MSRIGHVGPRWIAGLGLLALLSSCDRSAQRESADRESAEREQKQASVGDPAQPAAPTTSTAAPTDATVLFEPIDPRSIPARGVPSGLEGRFGGRPAVVASPCGFHLVVSQPEYSWTALLVGRDLSWTKEGSPLLLKLDGLTLDVGLVEAKAMGAVGRLEPDRLLRLAAQWESTWLRRDAGRDQLPIKDNAHGQAHLEPHPAWRAWSATLGPKATSADVPASHAVVATVALDQRALVLRALLDGDALALRALRRLVFAVDSIERRAGALGRRDFVETLQKAIQEDPTCAVIHAAHDTQLE